MSIKPITIFTTGILQILNLDDHDPKTKTKDKKNTADVDNESRPQSAPGEKSTGSAGKYWRIKNVFSGSLESIVYQVKTPEFNEIIPIICVKGQLAIHINTQTSKNHFLKEITSIWAVKLGSSIGNNKIYDKSEGIAYAEHGLWFPLQLNLGKTTSDPAYKNDKLVFNLMVGLDSKYEFGRDLWTRQLIGPMINLLTGDNVKVPVMAAAGILQTPVEKVKSHTGAQSFTWLGAVKVQLGENVTLNFSYGGEKYKSVDGKTLGWADSKLGLIWNY